MCLSREAAAWVDAHICAVAHNVGLRRALELVAAALWTFDPRGGRPAGRGGPGDPQ
jgi:hypothetical protein